MLGVDPEFGTSALRLWVAAGSAALLFLFCMLALFRRQPSAALAGRFRRAQRDLRRRDRLGARSTIPCCAT